MKLGQLRCSGKIIMYDFYFGENSHGEQNEETPHFNKTNAP